MRLLRLTNYLLAHRLLSLIGVVAITFIARVGVIGILFAGLVTLRKGILEGALFTAAATLPYLINFYFSNYPVAELSFLIWAAVGIAILSNTFTWIFSSMLYKHVSWSQLLQIAALLGVLLVSIIHLANPSVTNWWGNQLSNYYEKAIIMTKNIQNEPDKTPTESQLETINLTKQYATGLMTMAVLFNAILQLIASRWWQTMLFYPGLLRKELHHIRLSRLASILFVLSMILAYLDNKVAVDIMPILYMLFGAAGLSLIHCLLHTMASTTKWFWLWLIYIILVIALPTSLMLISILALFDSEWNIRFKLKKG